MPEAVEIELFRADPRASRGITAEHLSTIATEFDGSDPVPICIGHPKSDAPAYGEVTSFRAAGASLFGTLSGKFDKIVEGVKDKSILNRSMAFWSPGHASNPKPGKIWPRHLGFLGASTPGIPGMARLDKALAFVAADGDAGEDNIEAAGDPAPAVIFEAAPTPVISFQAEQEPTMDPTAEQVAEAARLKAEGEALDARRLAFEADQKTAIETANAAIVDGLVAGGKVLPKDADRLKLVFNALESEPLEFEAGKPKRSAASELAALLGGAIKLVPVGDGRRSPSTEFSADEDSADPNKITAKARALMKEEEGLTFEAAVERVTGQTENQEG